MTRRPFLSETDFRRTKTMPLPKPRDPWNSALIVAAGLAVCGVGFWVLAGMVS